MGGSLDQPKGSVVKRKIHFEDVTAYTPAQIQTYFNDNLGNKGWHIIQIIVIGSSKFLLAERVV